MTQPERDVNPPPPTHPPKKKKNQKTQQPRKLISRSIKPHTRCFVRLALLLLFTTLEFSL